MEVICLEEKAFYTLVETVVARIKKTEQIPQNKWIDGEEAMHLLNIKSKTTLQKLRDEGKIRYSQPQPRIILYDRESINEYLDQHAQNTF
ncbi:MAG: helix-turn-helix domain-containing protein [Owenweeksia sp.]